MNVTISTYTPDDQEGILEINSKTPIDGAYPYTWEQYSKGLLRDIAAKTHHIFVAKMDKRVVGYAAVRESHVDFLAVDPEMKGQGVGKALMKRAVSETTSGVLSLNFRGNRPQAEFYRHIAKALGHAEFTNNGEFLNGDPKIHLRITRIS